VYHRGHRVTAVSRELALYFTRSYILIGWTGHTPRV
jgi:hypothetical protein